MRVVGQHAVLTRLSSDMRRATLNDPMTRYLGELATDAWTNQMTIGVAGDR